MPIATAVFLNKILLRILCMAAFRDNHKALQQSSVDVTENVLLAKCNIPNTWSFIEKNLLIPDIIHPLLLKTA